MKSRSHYLRGLALAAVTLLCLAACARKETKVMSTELEMQHQIDLGTILDTTTPLQLSIPVANRSDRKITISRLSKDCSCTAVTIDKTSLLPGESAHIRVSANLTGKTNHYIGEIVIESDATERIDEIQISGQITGQIRIRPLRTSLVLGDKYAPGDFTVFCDDQTGKWKYAGFTADDPALQVEINPKASSPTTSTYAGSVNIAAQAKPKASADFQTFMVTLKFVNERIGRTLTLNLPVDVVVRRNLTTDPEEITFSHAGRDQKRTVLVQSGDPINIDSVACSSPSVKSSLRWIDKTTLMVDLAYEPASDPADVPDDLACDLLSGGKRVASIPIHVVRVP